jgi:hypothetical protein
MLYYRERIQELDLGIYRLFTCFRHNNQRNVCSVIKNAQKPIILPKTYTFTDSQYKGAYAVFFKEKINLVMRNSNNRF